MSSMVLDGASPRSRTSDPVTSVDAGRAVNAVGSRAAVELVLCTGAELTQGELEQRLPEWSPSRVRSAVAELEADGLVVATGETRPTRYGRRARVYKAVVPSE